VDSEVPIPLLICGKVPMLYLLRLRAGRLGDSKRFSRKGNIFPKVDRPRKKKDYV
jgi:hypothetical protein